MPATAPITAPSAFNPDAPLVELPPPEGAEGAAVALDNAELMELRSGWLAEDDPDAAELAELVAALARLEADDAADDTTELIEDRAEDKAL